VLALLGCHPAPPEPERFEAGRLGALRLFPPYDSPSSLVFLFSDAGGWSSAFSAAARELAVSGALVAGVDLPTYLARLAASDDGCHYLLSEIEDTSHTLQRRFPSDRYLSPILAGVGSGGTLSYAALAQAPWATVAGAVAVDAAPSLATRVPLCSGAESSPAPGGGFRYAPYEWLPGFWQDVRAGAPGAAPARPATAQELDLLVATLRPLLAQEPAAVLGDLPLVEIPAETHGEQMAVVYSGDGGWRDIDKTLGEILAEHGTPVVGVDSLRYFWHEKTPDEMARDLAEIIDHYRELWSTPRVLLIGYSFGADVLPFAVNRLPPAQRAAVVQVTLLGVEPNAPFEIHVSGWLGAEQPEDAPEVLPELLRIPAAQVQCVYGEEEEDTLCRAPELAGAEIIRTGGGHHFDEDYPALAQRILDGADRRAHRRPAPPTATSRQPVLGSPASPGAGTKQASGSTGFSIKPSPCSWSASVAQRSRVIDPRGRPASRVSISGRCASAASRKLSASISGFLRPISALAADGSSR
jgi:type IV secretory pathway VirJ component